MRAADELAEACARCEDLPALDPAATVGPPPTDLDLLLREYRVSEVREMKARATALKLTTTSVPDALAELDTIARRLGELAHEVCKPHATPRAGACAVHVFTFTCTAAE